MGALEFRAKSNGVNNQNHIAFGSLKRAIAKYRKNNGE
jgi:hypothetical protein